MEIKSVQSPSDQRQHNIHKTLHRSFTVRKGDCIVIPESVNGGFAMKLRPKRR